VGAAGRRAAGPPARSLCRVRRGCRGRSRPGRGRRGPQPHTGGELRLPAKGSAEPADTIKDSAIKQYTVKKLAIFPSPAGCH
jgi:hypothetical protein